jgi:hypothetical protein
MKQKHATTNKLGLGIRSVHAPFRLVSIYSKPFKQPVQKIETHVHTPGRRGTVALHLPFTYVALYPNAKSDDQLFHYTGKQSCNAQVQNCIPGYETTLPGTKTSHLGKYVHTYICTYIRKCEHMFKLLSAG